MIKRIAVLGSGAIGSMVGGMLTKAGHDVTLMEQWPEHVEAMKKVGLRLSGTCGEHVVPVKALHIHEMQGLREPFDYVFISVKSYDTEWATAMAVANLRKPDGVVVDFQNGINDERVAGVAGRGGEPSGWCPHYAGGCAGGAAIRPDRGPLGCRH